jgi:hypothetical protein
MLDNITRKTYDEHLIDVERVEMVAQDIVEFDGKYGNVDFFGEVRHVKYDDKYDVDICNLIRFSPVSWPSWAKIELAKVMLKEYDFDRVMLYDDTKGNGYRG